MQESLHPISPTEVIEAVKLRESGSQRLRRISATGVTTFQFTLPCTSGAALIQIKVHPVKRCDSHHPFYDVQAHYETAHPHQPIEHSIVEQVQCIYDTYIQAVRWTFDLECFGRHQDLLPCDVCSDSPAPPDVSQCLVVQPTRAPCFPTPESTFEEWRVVGMPNAELVPSTPYTKAITTTPDAAGLRRPRLPDGLSLAKPKRPKYGQPSVDDIITALASTVLKGSKENSKEGLLPAREIREITNSFIKKCQAATSGKDLDKLLLQFATEFRKNKKKSKREGTIKAWFSWYLSSCLHYFRYKRNVARGDRRNDQPSRAIEVLHSIIDTLLLTDGIVALSVITSFAVQGRILAEAAKRNESDRRAISKGVAEILKGKLHIPSGLDIPNPIFCIVLILDKEKDLAEPQVSNRQCNSLLQAYNFLNFPNLALLRLHQAAAVISFPDLQARWTAFTTSTPQFEKLRQLLRLVGDLKACSASLLRSLRDSIALFKAEQIDEALAILQRVEESGSESGSSALQKQPNGERSWLDLIKDFTCLLCSRLSACIRDDQETTTANTNTTTSVPPEVRDVAWDPIGDWSGMGTTNFPDGGAVHLETTSTWQDDDGNATFDGYNSTDPLENEAQISDFDQLLNIDWTVS